MDACLEGGEEGFVETNVVGVPGGQQIKISVNAITNAKLHDGSVGATFVLTQCVVRGPRIGLDPLSSKFVGEVGVNLGGRCGQVLGGLHALWGGKRGAPGESNGTLGVALVGPIGALAVPRWFDIWCIHRGAYFGTLRWQMGGAWRV